MNVMYSARSVGRTALVLLLVLAALACDTTEPVVDDHPLEFSASAEVVADTVFFRLTATNVSDTTVVLNWGQCEPEAGPLMSVHDAAGGSTSLRWDEAEWLRQRGGCFSPYPVASDRTILPGEESLPLNRRIAVARILGDSLPDGQYRLFVSPSFGEDIPRRPIDVGIFTLAR